MVNVAAVYERPEDKHSTPGLGRPASPRRCARVTPGAYVNFLGDEGQARVREAYPGPTWERLAAIKARYDPTNLFRPQPEHPTDHSQDQRP